MFYRSKEQLKAQLEERLRTALEFATLGAYESDSLAHPEPARGPQARVFLFAKVSPPCPHSVAPAAACDAAGADASDHRGAPASRSLVGTRARTRRGRRGGAAAVAAQPCTWPGKRD